MAEPTGPLEAAGRGGGAIVNLSSTAGVESVGSPAGWVSATHGVMGLTKVAALGKTVMLEILTPGGLEAYFERSGLTIQDDWIEELERTYGVKL